MLDAPVSEAPAEPFSGAPSGPLQDTAPITPEESPAEVPVVPTEPAE
jgi:hypothetical protein